MDAEAGKRKRNNSDTEALKAGKKSKNVLSCAVLVQPQRVYLLDLPQELLVEIFVHSLNSNLPETCRYLYNALYANPRTAQILSSPPMWLQERFVRNTNKTPHFAVRSCLRRRFFDVRTLKLFLPEIRFHGVEIPIPLRCVLKEQDSIRERLLYGELLACGFGVSETTVSRGLLYIAAHYQSFAKDTYFWRTTQTSQFTKESINKAFKLAVKNRAFQDGEMFAQLTERFGIAEDLGYQLYSMYARSRDQGLLFVLRKYNVKPNLDVLKQLIP